MNKFDFDVFKEQYVAMTTIVMSEWLNIELNGYEVFYWYVYVSSYDRPELYIENIKYLDIYYLVKCQDNIQLNKFTIVKDDSVNCWSGIGFNFNIFWEQYEAMTGIVLHEFRRVKELSQKNSWLRNYRVWFWYINDWRIRDIRYRVIHYMDRYKEDKGQGYLYKLLVTNEAIERSMDG